LSKKQIAPITRRKSQSYTEKDATEKRRQISQKNNVFLTKSDLATKLFTSTSIQQRLWNQTTQRNITTAGK